VPRCDRLSRVLSRANSEVCVQTGREMKMYLKSDVIVHRRTLDRKSLMNFIIFFAANHSQERDDTDNEPYHRISQIQSLSRTDAHAIIYYVLATVVSNSYFMS